MHDLWKGGFLPAMRERNRAERENGRRRRLRSTRLKILRESGLGSDIAMSVCVDG